MSPQQTTEEDDLREIAIIIDSWDDIFSDFDPRPFSERMVSSDFIDELRRRYTETRSGNFLITIYAPAALRNSDIERTVHKRLKQHFHQKFLQKKKELSLIYRRGMVFAGVGMCSLVFLTLATYYKFLDTLVIQLLEIILMPLGWFGLWEGFSKLIDTSPALLGSKMLYEKLSKARYSFKYSKEPEAKDAKTASA